MVNLLPFLLLPTDASNNFLSSLVCSGTAHGFHVSNPIPEASTSQCRNLVYFRRTVRLWLSLHFILRAIKIPLVTSWIKPEATCRQMVEKWEHRCDQYIFHKVEGLSGTEGPLAPKYHTRSHFFKGKVQVWKVFPFEDSSESSDTSDILLAELPSDNGAFGLMKKLVLVYFKL